MSENIKNKFCRDCHWSRDKYSDPNRWTCVSPQNFRIHATTKKPIISLITGAPELKIVTCYAARILTESCGPTGSWFQTHQEVIRVEFPYSPETPNIVKKLSKISLEDL